MSLGGGSVRATEGAETFEPTEWKGAVKRLRRPLPNALPPWRRTAFLLVALAAVFVLLGHDALMAAGPPDPTLHAGHVVAVDGAHQPPESPSHPTECGTAQVVAAPRAGDDLALAMDNQSPAPAAPAAVRREIVSAPGPLDRGTARSLLQIWRV